MISQVYQYPTGKIIIFAKQPSVGKVKTRLIPAMGAKRATLLYQQLLQNTVEKVTQLPLLAAVKIYTSPTIQHPLLAQMKHFYPASFLRLQKGKCLGEKMFYAFKEALKGTDFVILIGTDCPEISYQMIQLVCEKIQEKNYQAVIYPAKDGGYVLIALKIAHFGIFRGVAWGTDKVLQQTRQRLRQYGYCWYEGKAFQDFDNPQDIVYFRKNKIYRKLLCFM